MDYHSSDSLHFSYFKTKYKRQILCKNRKNTNMKGSHFISSFLINRYRFDNTVIVINIPAIHKMALG